MRTQPTPTRAGTILPVMALSITGLFGFLALAVDLGVLAITRTQCQNAADAAALAGARQLNNATSAVNNNSAAADTEARNTVRANYQLNTQFANANISAVDIGTYSYNTGTQRFDAAFTGSKLSTESWTAMRVNLTANQPTFFARIFGIQSMPTGATAVAVHRPRDIAFVLDFSGSMGYGSSLNWPNGGTIEGLMNPDPAYPKFGHYARYTFYQNTSPTNAASATVASRPNPFQMKGFSGNYAPNNHTMETGGGPPMIEDFLEAAGSPATVNAATVMNNAFKMWSPAKTANANTTTLTPAAYNYAGYPPAGGDFSKGCPAPDNYDIQSDSPIAYVGDKWPRTDGSRGAQAAAWTSLSGSTFTDAAAKTVKEFLSYAFSPAAGRTLTGFNLPSGGTANVLLPTGTDGGTADAHYLDVVWERYGYDLDMVNWRSQTGGTRTAALLSADQRFKGYSMGPGYVGKTFFVWPPDPRWGADGNTYGAANGSGVRPDRLHPTQPNQDQNSNWICDWRRRFFLRGDGAAFDPQTDNINRILFRTTAGHVLNDVVTAANTTDGVTGTPGYFRINYPAVMAWIKSNVKTLPANLRAGRILYYSGIPDDLTEGGAGNADDKRFWRHYVHYVLGVAQFDATNAPIQTWTYNAPNMLAGVESRNTFGALSVTAPAQFTPTPGTTANRRPYMCYTDNVNRPRLHFWFGPQSMLQFLERAGEDRPWWAGTVREAQCWQLKAAINSVLDDIRSNHPNDWCGSSFFATRSHFNTPLAPMGQDWFALKNTLFFRKDTVAALKANANDPIEHRPYTSTMGTTTTQIPNGSGATDPVSGMAVAFNLLSSSSLLPAADYGNRGRRGAAKVVIFETDGIPNTTWGWSITGTGVDTRYQNSGTSELWGGDGSLNDPGKAAVRVVQRIVAPTSTTGISGHSTPNTPARVYAIGFGDLFEGYTGTNFSSMNGTAQGALRFLLRVQQVGNTSSAGDPPTATIPIEQVIAGPYQRPDPTLPEHPTSNPPGRIEKLRSALERIMQSGVQVTLIQ